MPHIIVKLWPGKSEQQKTRLAEEIVKDVMRLKIPYLWLQEGVCHEEAVKWAEADGILVAMDRCIYKEHARLDRVSQ